MTNASIYINGLGNISPQKTSDSSRFLDDPLYFEANRLTCLDPGYKDYIPADMIRRMGRIIRMGVAASKICLKDALEGSGAGEIIPNAIITGTGLGCIEDTEKFLASMIRNNEEFLTPTSFIQSTHNTVAGQIALLLGCHGYNFTFVHRGISFESALTDALMQIGSGDLENALVGGTDEVTANSFAIMSRLGFWKRKPVSTERLLSDNQRGAIAGEGAAFFFLGNKKTDHTYARLAGVETFLKPGSGSEVIDRLHTFLLSHSLTTDHIDLVVLGLNGDPRSDEIYRQVAGAVFRRKALAWFKHLCGEYHTASSFGMWLAAMAIKKQTVPDATRLKNAPGLPKEVNRDNNPIHNVLIYNHYRNTNHAFILLTKD